MLASFDANVEAVIHDFFRREGASPYTYGLLKYELLGGWGLFWSPKCYYVGGGDGESVKRFKGCNRAARERLRPEDFDQSARSERDRLYARRHKLSPSGSFQILKEAESRKLTSAITLKRRTEVLPFWGMGARSGGEAALAFYICFFFPPPRCDAYVFRRLHR